MKTPFKMHQAIFACLVLSLVFAGCSKKVDLFASRNALSTSLINQDGFIFVTADDIGLVADGTTDNTVKFQQYLDTHSNVEIRFSEGIYIIDSVFIANTGIHLIGNSTTFKTNGFRKRKNIVTTLGTTNFLLKNFVVDGSSINAGLLAAVELDNMTNSVVSNVKVAGLPFSNGINSVFSDHILVDSCEVTGCGNGIEIFGGDAKNPNTTTRSTDVTVSNCKVSDIKKQEGFPGGESGGGIFTITGDQINFIGNSVSNCDDVGLDLENCYNSTIRNCFASGCKNGNISLFYACKNVKIENNTSESSTNSNFGIHFFGDSAGRLNTNISVNNNTVNVIGGGVGIYIEQESTFDATFSLNTVNIGSTASGFRSIVNDSLNLKDNRFNAQATSGFAISNEGGSKWRVANNVISNSPIYSGSGFSVGIKVFSYSFTDSIPLPPATGNVFTNNEISGFDASIFDDSNSSPNRPDNTYTGNKIENFYEAFVNEGNAEMLKANNILVVNNSLIKKNGLSGYRNIYVSNP